MYNKRQDLRSRVFSLRDSGYIVNKLPSDVKLEALEYRFVGKRLVVTDGLDFVLDINEFGAFT